MQNKKEKRVIRKHANTWENKAPSKPQWQRGGWQDLVAEQDGKTFLVRNLYSLVVLFCRKVEDVPPWAGKPKKVDAKIFQRQPKNPKVDSLGIVKTLG